VANGSAAGTEARIMSPLFKHLFLLSLLIADWAYDTHFGNYFFSQPMSSSHATLNRPGTDDDDHHQANKLDRGPVCGLVSLEWGVLLPDLVLHRDHVSLWDFHQPDLVYVFKSLRL
jgi:hypothetical protein